MKALLIFEFLAMVTALVAAYPSPPVTSVPIEPVVIAPDRQVETTRTRQVSKKPVVMAPVRQRQVETTRTRQVSKKPVLAIRRDVTTVKKSSRSRSTGNWASPSPPVISIQSDQMEDPAPEVTYSEPEVTYDEPEDHLLRASRHGVS